MRLESVIAWGGALGPPAPYPTKQVSITCTGLSQPETASRAGAGGQPQCRPEQPQSSHRHCPRHVPESKTSFGSSHFCAFSLLGMMPGVVSGSHYWQEGWRCQEGGGPVQGCFHSPHPRL